MSHLLRIATAGSVDDGKSTLIGRLLHDSKAIFEDQLHAVENASRARGEDVPDLALLTDGLRAEREQGITIDVAYRYFATPQRKFVIADTPGHVQYTRNMVTGASTADVALVLVDARHGVVEQSRRHASLASLLGLPHLVLCVNKMDLVDWSRERFDDIRAEFATFAESLGLPDPTVIPMSALSGENVVSEGDTMPWYDGPSLLGFLEHLEVSSGDAPADVRLPVQYVVHTRGRSAVEGFRGYAGTLAGGALRPGDPVVVDRSGLTSTVTAVRAPGGREVAEARPGDAVTVELADDVDLARGDMICSPAHRPERSPDIEAMVCWFSGEATLRPGRAYVLQQAASTTKATVRELIYRLDVDTLDRDAAIDELGMNDIARVSLRTTAPLSFDEYARNRQTGSFILIDEATNDTVCAGMIVGAARTADEAVWHRPTVCREDRASRGMTVWLTGLSGAGKSTVAVELERRLVGSGRPAYLLDGDNLRYGLNAGLGFGPTDRAENVRRVGEVAALFADAGMVAIVALVSPYREDRERVRAMHDERGLAYAEVFVDTPLETCAGRDPKGLYARAEAGKLAGMTGVDDPYEAPLTPELRLTPEDGAADEQASRVAALIEVLQDGGAASA